MKNSLTIKEYILCSLFCSITAYIWYRNLFYTNIRGCSTGKSHIVLGGIIIATFVINIFISGKWARNEKSIVATTLFPFGLYAFITFSQYLSKTFMVIVFITGFVSVSYVLFIFSRRIVNVNNKKKYLKARARRSYIGVRSILAFGSIAIVVCTFAKANMSDGLVSSKEIQGTAVYGDEYAMSANMDKFLLLPDEEWKKLSVEQKVTVLQAVLNCEGRYLGLNKKLTLYSSKLQEGTLGYYNYVDGIVQIDIDQLSGESRDAVETICHEAFHAAQHQYADIYDQLDESDKNSYFMLDAATYSHELKNYENGDRDMYAYASQKCEQEARYYGLSSSQQIYERIDDYLEKYGD